MVDPDRPEQPEKSPHAAAGAAESAARAGGSGETGGYPVFLEPAGHPEPLETVVPPGAGSPPAGQGGALRSLLSSPSRRRSLVIGGAAVTAVLLFIGVATLWPDPGEHPVTGQISRAFERADPVPRGPIVASVPPGCGVSAYTLDRLALRGAEEHGLPSGDAPRTCEWEQGVIAASLGGGKRELTITIMRHDSIGSAIDGYSREVGRSPNIASESRAGPMKTLSGLGVEALLWYQVDSTAPIYPGGKQRKGYPRTSQTTIVFRQGNVVATVGYGGADYQAGRLFDTSKREQVLPEAAARDGALIAARDVARSMGLLADGAGRVGPPVAGASLPGEIPGPCDLLPAATLKVLGAGDVAPRLRDTYVLPRIGDIEPQGCAWDNLEVGVLAVPESAKGGAEPQAVRTYLGEHYYNRDRRPDGDAPHRFFSALSGPGDQAFVVFESDGISSAKLVFRVRNVLVGVRYTYYAGGHRDTTLNRVYTAAVEIARNLHG